MHVKLEVLVLQGRETPAEKRYRKLLLSGLELNKDFYFSYTYNLARTLQANLTTDAPGDPFDSMFVWNEFLSRCCPAHRLLQHTHCYLRVDNPWHVLMQAHFFIQHYC